KPLSATLKPEAARSFDRYVQLTEAQNASTVRSPNDFLWIDGPDSKEDSRVLESMRKGDVVVSKLETRDSGKELSFPGAMVHHWVGTIFNRGAALEDVLKILQDYNQQSVYYAPDVERSHIESRDGDNFQVFLRFRRHMVITVVMDTEHKVQYFR